MVANPAVMRPGNPVNARRARKYFPLSMMSLLISASFTFAHAADDTLVVTAQEESATGSSQQDYSVPITTAGTKMSMVPRDIPQSVSIISQQRMQDQDLQTLGEVMTNTTGITASNIDSDRSDYYARGFLINNYLYDDIPTSISNLWNFGDAGSDTAI